MKPKANFLLIALAFLLIACSSRTLYYRPTPATTNPNNIFISSGVSFAVSNMTNSMVTVSAIRPAGGQLELYVAYNNLQLDRTDAIPDSIQIVYENQTQSGKLQVYSADEYLVKLQRRQNSAMFAKAFSDGYNAQSAAYTTTTTTTSTVSPSGNYVPVTTTTVTYDASKTIAANARSQHERNQMANNFYQYRQSLNQKLLRTNTLFKGQSVEGKVIVKSNNDADVLYITVPFAGEQHKFVLVQTP